MRVAAVLGMATLAGCSWVLPHPSPNADLAMEAADEGRCTLELGSERKNLWRRGSAAGIPTPLIIRLAPGHDADRQIRNHQLVYFLGLRTADQPADANRNLQTWKIDELDQAGRHAGNEDPLVESSIVYLRSTGGDYLRVERNGTRTLSPDAAAAATFVLYKADVPDPNRPSTCDFRLRNGDYVFVQARSPNLWLGYGELGQSPGLPPAPPSASINVQKAFPTSVSCPREEQICGIDQNGSNICTWSPVCNDATAY